MSIRPPAVAGRFYPRDPDELRRTVKRLLAAAQVRQPPANAQPRAIIVPHAGYAYSGPIAASAYCRLEPWADQLTHVLLIGPAHRTPLEGLAVSSANGFETPLGLVPIDDDGRRIALEVAGVQVHDFAHQSEHSLEVQLPFLQTVLPNASIVPVLAGRTQPEVVAELLDRFLDRPNWLVVISSDLSHFHATDECQQLDAATSAVIEHLADDELDGQRACGHLGIRGLLQAARRRDWCVAALDVRHSGDTAGPRDSVVGYGAYEVRVGVEALTDHARKTEFGSAKASTPTVSKTPVMSTDNAITELNVHDRHALLDAARRSIVQGLHGERAVVDSSERPALQVARACFVTLRTNSDLRGCMGCLEAVWPLIRATSYYAHQAAFHDPRFSPLELRELSELTIQISVLTRPQPIECRDEDDLLRELQPGIDGVILTDGRRTATLLPQVWQQAPTPDEFLAHLKHKAGLSAEEWPATVKFQRYRAESFGETDAPGL